MSRVVLRQPFAECRHGGEGKGALPLPSVSVSLSQKGGSTIAFRVTVDAILHGGIAHVGSVRTTPPNGERVPARAVCLASYPGAIAWRVRATPIAAGTDRAGGYLIVDGCPDLGARAIIPLNASLLLSGGPDAGEYAQDTGTAAGVTNVPAGARVRGYSLIANGVGSATIAIGTQPAITVPTGAAFGDTPDNIIGPVAFTFAGNVASRWVSWIDPE
jgi:hypothetical protein